MDYARGENMAILMVGATGLVGSHILDCISLDSHGMARQKPSWLQADHPFTQTDAFSGSFSDWKEYLTGVRAIIFLAFPTNLDAVESYSDKEGDLLVKGYQNFLEAARANNCSVIFFSSDAVMWGMRPEHRRPGTRATTPINRYAALKIACENLTLDADLFATYVLRCVPVGIHKYDPYHGFVGSVIRRSLSETAVGFKDTLFNPVSIGHLIRIINLWLIGLRHDDPNPLGMNRIIHVGTQDAMSKYEFLLPMIEQVKGSIQEGSVTDISFKAPRSSDQRLILSEIPGLEPLNIKDVQSEIMQQLSFFSFSKGR